MPRVLILDRGQRLIPRLERGKVPTRRRSKVVPDCKLASLKVA